MIQNKLFAKKLLIIACFANILLISSALSYYTVFFSEKEAQSKAAISNQIENNCNSNLVVMINSMLFKLVIAFICGGMISEKQFITIGLI